MRAGMLVVLSAAVRGVKGDADAAAMLKRAAVHQPEALVVPLGLVQRRPTPRCD